MKILYLTNIPSPYRVEFFNELGKLCELDVLFERRSAADRNTHWRYSGKINFNEIYLTSKNITKDGALCFGIVNYLSSNTYDLIIIGGYSTPTAMLAIQFLKFKKIPFILNADGGFIKKERKIVYYIKKYFISSATWWFSSSNMTDEYLQYYGAKKENIYRYKFTSLKKHEILKEITPIEQKEVIKKDLGINSDNIVLSVGQFIHRKGFDILIKNWKSIDKSISLILIGGGEEKLYLQQLIKDNNLQNIFLIDFKSKQELLKYYLASDIFVLLTREDIWGLVINEAMAMGLPIITTNKCLAGLELVVDDENGFVINLNNRKEFLKKINYILENQHKKKFMQLNNIKKVSDYTIENMALDHYNALIKITNLGR